MASWPSITEPLLLERLRMGDAEFVALLQSWAAQVAPRPYQRAAFERAIGYPWARPESSYLLTDAGVEMLDELTARERRGALERFASVPGRWPLLAFGSNAAPSVLTQKFADLAAEDDRAVLVLAGRLHDFDVGVAPQPTVLYAAMPATLFPSPGTAVRAAVLWVTEAQFTRLAWGEMSYHLGLLDAHFEADQAVLELDRVLAFVSRFGSFCINDRPVALAPISAAGRTAPALSQEQLLDAAAALAIGPGGTAEMLVRAIFEHPQEIGPKITELVRPASLAFASDRWTPLPEHRTVGT